MAQPSPKWLGSLDCDGIVRFLAHNLSGQGLLVSEIAYALGVSQRRVKRELRALKREKIESAVGSRDANGRARARMYGVSAEVVDLVRVYLRDKGICHLCQQPVPLADFHFDHVLALARGGDHAARNLAVAHSACNLRKGAR